MIFGSAVTRCSRMVAEGASGPLGESSACVSMMTRSTIGPHTLFDGGGLPRSAMIVGYS